MKNVNENVKRCANSRKENLIKVFGAKCCLCGYNLYTSALEFHHVNPSTKCFSLCGSGLMKAMPSQLEEAKKCILVCANCHRGIHHHAVEVPQNWQQFYLEDVANNLLNEYFDKKQIHLHYCIDCGQEISHKAIRCVDCANKYQQLTNRPDRETLKNLIRTVPFTTIGKMFEVSDNAIRKWCKNENLPFTKTIINSYSDDEWSKI